jgi:hypothetical protein
VFIQKSCFFVNRFEFLNYFFVALFAKHLLQERKRFLSAAITGDVKFPDGEESHR